MNDVRCGLYPVDWACFDCGQDILHLGEYYVVEDRVWMGEAMLDPRDGVMCIGCLEHRIGRRLGTHDFPDIPVNQFHYWHMSERWPSSRFLNRLRTPTHKSRDRFLSHFVGSDAYFPNPSPNTEQIPI